MQWPRWWPSRKYIHIIHFRQQKNQFYKWMYVVLYISEFYFLCIRKMLNKSKWRASIYCLRSAQVLDIWHWDRHPSTTAHHLTIMLQQNRTKWRAQEEKPLPTKLTSINFAEGLWYSLLSRKDELISNLAQYKITWANIKLIVLEYNMKKITCLIKHQTNSSRI